jgi:hypothetical protein
MNTPDDLDLLRRLRQLPREREPANDLWRGIAARIEPRRARAPRRWGLAGLALAATVAVVAVLATRLPRTAPVAPDVASQPARAPAQFVRLQADALTLEYTVALQAFDGEAMPPEFRSAAYELDDSARRIRSALRDEPDAVYLLDRLRRTYDQRLKLSQRALVG